MRREPKVAESLPFSPRAELKPVLLCSTVLKLTDLGQVDLIPLPKCSHLRAHRPDRHLRQLLLNRSAQLHGRLLFVRLLQRQDTASLLASHVQPTLPSFSTRTPLVFTAGVRIIWTSDFERSRRGKAGNIGFW